MALNGADARSYGTVFNEGAGEYGRHRPTYPDVLIDRACEMAGVGPGVPVLEIGCGTGQLSATLWPPRPTPFTSNSAGRSARAPSPA